MHTTLFRVFEILVYTLLNAVPYHFCVLYIFRNRLRFSLPKTILLLTPATLLELMLNLLVVFDSHSQTGMISLLWATGYVLSYCLVVKEPLGKTGFILLFMLNLNNFNIVASKYLESLLFPALSMERYHYSNTLTMILTELLLLASSFISMRRRFRPAVERDSSSFFWRYLWLVPATFYFLWHYHIFFNDTSSLEVATDAHSLFFLSVINCGAYLIYYIVLRMVNESAENTQLRTQNHQLALQTLQYENLQDRISETRKANHDLRHHITVMQGYLEKEDYPGLGQYFSTLKAQTPGGNLHYCQHYTLNMLLAYFSQMARENGIDHTIRVHVPQDISIPDNDLTVLLGNLLENALEASMAQTSGAKKLLVAGNVQGNRLLFTIDNTFSTPIRQDKSGAFLSSKRPGRGIGMESARSIARRHGGDLRTEQRDGMFCVSVYLIV